jgi:hypothetical protein
MVVKYTKTSNPFDWRDSRNGAITYPGEGGPIDQLAEE